MNDTRRRVADNRVTPVHGRRSRQGTISGALAALLLVTISGCVQTSGTAPGQSTLAPTEANSVTQSPASAVAAFQQQQYVQAIDLFKQQLQPGTTDEPKVWFNLGASHWNAGHKSDALEAYKQAAALNPLYLKAYQRLTAHYRALGSKDQALKYAKVGAVIQRTDKTFERMMDKAATMRAKGPVYFKAIALVHDKKAEYYDKAGFPPQAEAERKLAGLSRSDEERERRQPMEAAQRAQAEADERAFNTELLGTVKDLSATVMKVNPDSPFGGTGMGASGFSSSPAKSLGGNSGQMAIAGLGIAEQSMRAYSDILNASEGKLQAQREVVRQQGLQAQAALADPAQAKAQQQARQRTQQLLQQLDELERVAAEELGDELALEGAITEGDRDTLDL